MSDPDDISSPDFGRYFDELPLWSAPFARMVLEIVPLRRGASILDVGAGTGSLSIELAQRCGESSRVVAVDPWAAASVRLREKLDYLGLDNVSVVEAPIEEVVLAPASFDLVVSNLGLNNFSDAPAALARCAELAKPGATLCLSTNLSGHMAELYEELDRVLEARGLEEARGRLELHVAKRGTVESVCGLVEAAGFEHERTATDSFRLRFADGAALLGHRLIRLGFLADWQGLVGDAQVAEVFDALLSELDRRAGGREISLEIPMACLSFRRPSRSR